MEHFPHSNLENLLTLAYDPPNEWFIIECEQLSREKIDVDIESGTSHCHRSNKSSQYFKEQTFDFFTSVFFSNLTILIQISSF